MPESVKPDGCPFCGSPPNLRAASNVVECSECGCSLYVDDMDLSDAEKIEAWNRRARPPQDAKPVAWTWVIESSGIQSGPFYSVEEPQFSTYDRANLVKNLTALYASPPLAIEALREAATDLIASRTDTYRAGNNRQVGIEDDSGEKMWIVPFDAMHALEQAITNIEKDEKE